HAVDDGGGALAALEDLLEGLGPARLVGGVAEGEPGVVDDRRQDVVELVRHAAGQGPDARELLGLEKLLAELVGLGAGKHHVLADHLGLPPLGCLIAWRPACRIPARSSARDVSAALWAALHRKSLWNQPLR